MGKVPGHGCPGNGLTIRTTEHGRTHRIHTAPTCEEEATCPSTFPDGSLRKAICRTPAHLTIPECRYAIRGVITKARGRTAPAFPFILIRTG